MMGCPDRKDEWCRRTEPVVSLFAEYSTCCWLITKMCEGYSIDPKMFAGLYFLEFGEALFAR